MGSFIVSLVFAQFYSALLRLKANLSEAAPDRKNEVLLLLTGASLCYAAAAAVGRAGRGVGAAQAARYTCLLIPGAYACYLWALGQKRQWLRVLYLGTLATVLCLAFGSFPFYRYRRFRDWGQTKERWKDCYLRYANISTCNEMAKASIYEEPIATDLVKKLSFLKENHLNLYLDTPASLHAWGRAPAQAR
jgi:hypothetical protein